jgi:hypothetical protein
MGKFVVHNSKDFLRLKQINFRHICIAVRVTCPSAVGYNWHVIKLSVSLPAQKSFDLTLFWRVSLSMEFGTKVMKGLNGVGYKLLLMSNSWRYLLPSGVAGATDCRGSTAASRKTCDMVEEFSL